MEDLGMWVSYQLDGVQWFSWSGSDSETHSDWHRCNRSTAPSACASYVHWNGAWLFWAWSTGGVGLTASRCGCWFLIKLWRQIDKSISGSRDTSLSWQTCCTLALRLWQNATFSSGLFHPLPAASIWNSNAYLAGLQSPCSPIPLPSAVWSKTFCNRPMKWS